MIVVHSVLTQMISAVTGLLQTLSDAGSDIGRSRVNCLIHCKRGTPGGVRAGKGSSALAVLSLAVV